MQTMLRGLGIRRDPRLEDWEHRPFAEGVEGGPRPRDNRDVYIREVAREPPGPPEAEGVHQRLAAAIWRYEIFPPQLVSGVLRRTPVQVGDTVGILYHAPLAVELFFAARVVEVIHGRRETSTGEIWRSGFTYRTLRGHPELGEETFAVDKDLATGAVLVSLRSWSRGGTFLARTFAPVVRRLQVHASYAALDHLERLAKQ